LIDIRLQSNNINKEEGLKLRHTSIEPDHQASSALWSSHVMLIHQKDKPEDRPPFSGIVSRKGEERYNQEFICPSNYYYALV
jgi:hypothetical protein